MIRCGMAIGRVGCPHTLLGAGAFGRLGLGNDDDVRIPRQLVHELIARVLVPALHDEERPAGVVEREAAAPRAVRVDCQRCCCWNT